MLVSNLRITLCLRAQAVALALLAASMTAHLAAGRALLVARRAGSAAALAGAGLLTGAVAALAFSQARGPTNACAGASQAGPLENPRRFRPWRADWAWSAGCGGAVAACRSPGPVLRNQC
jgi:hypothetical protein